MRQSISQKALKGAEDHSTLQLEAGPVDEEQYQVFRSTTDLREPYRWAPAEMQAWSDSGPMCTLCTVAVFALLLALLHCRIGRQFLAGTKKFTAPDITEAPLIVFINSRSGGRAGPKLTEILYQSLGHSQVWLVSLGIFH